MTEEIINLHELEESKEQRDMTVACLDDMIEIFSTGKYNQLAILNALLTAVNNCVHDMGIEKESLLNRMSIMHDLLGAMKEGSRATTQ